MAVRGRGLLIKGVFETVTVLHSRAHEQPKWLRDIPRSLYLALICLVLVVATGCSSHKTQSISESYVQSVLNLNNGLVKHVGDASRLTSASRALQQADSLIRQAVKRRDEALKAFAEINADFDATPEQLRSLVTTNQSANTSDVETLINLIAGFQSDLTSEELTTLYPERAEFASQTLMLLDEY